MAFPQDPQSIVVDADALARRIATLAYALELRVANVPGLEAAGLVAGAMRGQAGLIVHYCDLLAARLP
jgi:hypothetical protein